MSDQPTMMFPRSTMLHHHLVYNHYPPQSAGLIPYCEQAIDAVNDGEPERVVEIQVNGESATLINHGEPVTAAELVEELHLEGFCNE